MTEANTVGQCLWMRDEPTGPFITDLLARLRQYRPVVFTYGAPAAEDRAALRVPIYAPYSRRSAPLRRFSNRATRRLLGCPWEFRRAIARHGVRLLHAHCGYCALEYAPLSRRMGLPLITTFYGNDLSAFPRQPGIADQLRGLFARGAHFIVLSEDMRRDAVALGCPPERTSILRIGVDLDRFAFRPRAAADDGEFHLLCIARFVPKKGLPYLLEAVAALRRRFPKVKLRIVGDHTAPGPARDAVLARLAAADLDGAVELVGYVPYAALVEHYDWAHAYVLPSVTGDDGDKEGTPHTILQAQACGLPVVATRHAGIPEEVIEGESGFLAPERDAAALADRIAALIADPTLGPRLGAVGRRHVERRYAPDRQVAELEALYTRLLEAKAR